MATIELNDPFTGEWTVFTEATHKYDGTLITTGNTDDIIYKNVNNVFYRRVLPNDTVNVRWFGASGDGNTNDTQAVQNACNIRKNIYFPEGIYLVNIEVKHKAKIFGASSSTTFIKPYDYNQPAMILNDQKAPYWQYATIIEELTFEGGNQTDWKGYGISMAKAHESEYSSQDEFNGNITFRNVDFKFFNKGLQGLFGNIGMDFYSVGIHHNKYGMYFLDNKFGTNLDIMHAGNKYFYSGEISGNEVGIYIHNETEGFGGVTFSNVIFEHNDINTYINGNNAITPIVIESCWNEGSGTVKKTTPISIDTWSGSTKGQKNINPHTHIFEGKNLNCNVNNSFVSDYYINGENIIVKATNCYTESNIGVNAAESKVEGYNSNLILYRPSTIFGLPKNDNIILADSLDYSRTVHINNNSNSAVTRPAISTPRFNKVGNIKNKLKSVTLETSEILTGNLAPVTGMVVNDGVIFETCNQFNIPFPTLPSGGDPNYVTSYMRLENSLVNTHPNKGGYYVITFDMKVNSGDPTFFVWNENEYQVMQYTPTVKNKWQTIVGYASADPLDTHLSFFLDISALAPVDIHLSAYQVLRFDTSIEAKSFLESKVFAL